jgi:hypothetical protein
MTNALVLCAFAFLCAPQDEDILTSQSRHPAPSPSDLIVDLATRDFIDLSDAERRFLEGVATGRGWSFTPPSDQPDSPMQGETWSPLRTVRAAVIAWVCHSKSTAELITKRGIILDGAHIDGSLDLQMVSLDVPISITRCYCPDAVNLSAATLRGISFEGSRMGRVFADGLKADFVMFRNGFIADDSVTLIGAIIDRALDCSNGHFRRPRSQRGNEHYVAFSIASSTIGGNVALMQSRFDGELALTGANVAGQVNAAAVTILNSRSTALRADRLHVENSIIIGPSDATSAASRPDIMGRISFVGAQIDGSFIFAGLKQPQAYDLDLRDAAIGVLRDARDSWPSPGNLRLSGLEFKRLGDDFYARPVVKGPSDRLAWLRLQIPGWFSAQPYTQLADFYEREGERGSATIVRIEREKNIGRYGQVSFLRQLLWYRSFGWIIGFGYRPINALIGLVGLASVGTIWFALGRERFVAVNPILQRRWPFSPFMYSLNTLVQPVNLHQDENFLPRNDGTWKGCLLTWYLWLHICVGWVLTLLFVAAISGMLE